MKHLSKFSDFINEVSGTELIGPVGPGYGDTNIKNKTISRFDTEVIYCDLDNKFYTIDEYNNIYEDYLKKGGTPLHGFNIDNIVAIISHQHQL
jgi:hypothetical protein